MKGKTNKKIEEEPTIKYLGRLIRINIYLEDDTEYTRNTIYDCRRKMQKFQKKCKNQYIIRCFTCPIKFVLCFLYFPIENVIMLERGGRRVE